MTTQDLSRVCGIPIAVAYRRVGNLERNGLLRCVAQVEVPRGRGKKVSYYQCAVRAMKVIFVEGEFHTELEFLPEEDMIKPTKPSNGGNAPPSEPISACGPEQRGQPIVAKKPDNGHGTGSQE